MRVVPVFVPGRLLLFAFRRVTLFRRKSLGADDAAPSNLQHGGTRFVVSQTFDAPLSIRLAMDESIRRRTKACSIPPLKNDNLPAPPHRPKLHSFSLKFDYQNNYTPKTEAVMRSGWLSVQPNYQTS
jgi:hypothetical protein